ncbi:MAG: hypothetical protein ACFFES_18270, partial [Candidatus Thorarchaeota archaeon]
PDPSGHTVNQSGERLNQFTPGDGVAYDYTSPDVVYVLYQNSCSIIGRSGRADLICVFCYTILKEVGSVLMVLCLTESFQRKRLWSDTTRRFRKQFQSAWALRSLSEWYRLDRIALTYFNIRVSYFVEHISIMY